MKYTDTPCGRLLAKAEEELGPLSIGEKADLLLDNFMEIADAQEAREIAESVTVKAVL